MGGLIWLMGGPIGLMGGLIGPKVWIGWASAIRVDVEV